MPITKEPLFECQECGKKFYTVKAAERASFGDSGCPGCGGSDIDEYMCKKGKPTGKFGGKIHLKIKEFMTGESHTPDGTLISRGWILPTRGKRTVDAAEARVNARLKARKKR